MKTSDAMQAMADAQRSREQRATVAKWLRSIAERISPDDEFVSVRTRLRFDPSFRPVATYTGTQHQEGPGWDNVTDDGARVYVRRKALDRMQEQIR